MKLTRVLALFLSVLLFACNTQQPATVTVATTVPPTAQPTAPAVGTVSAARPPSPTSSKPPIQTPAWFNDVVLYEIFPRSFSDSNDDGIGDLNGITSKLDYLHDLGVGALWLTPIFASPSYHGYDTSDYYAINPEFGSEADLVNLVQEAHKRDIKVLLDFVAGHTSDQHPFFQDAYGNPASKYADWYRWLDDRHTQYQHFGSATNLPSLNQDNPATRQYLIDAAKYWMDKTDIDGYRLDYALGPSHAFWKTFRAELKATDPDFLLLGEVWDSGLKIAPYYDNEFDATFNFPVYFDLMGSHERDGASPLLGAGSPAAFESALVALKRLYNPGAQSVQFINNHDTVRVASQLPDPERAKLAATLLLTLPSTPMVYYGQEIGMLGDKTDGDKSVREPMDWYASESGAGMPTWYMPAAGFNRPDDGVSVEEQQDSAGSLLEHYRALITLRREHPALRSGEFVPVPLPGSPRVVAFLRRDESETILVLINFDTQAVTIPLPSGELPANFAGFTNLQSGDTLLPPASRDFSIVVPPLNAQLLRLIQS